MVDDAEAWRRGEYPAGSDEAVYEARRAADEALDAFFAAQAELRDQLRLNVADE